MKIFLPFLAGLLFSACTTIQAPCYNITLTKVKRDIKKAEPGFNQKVSRMDFFLEQSIRFMLEDFAYGDNCSALNLEILYQADDPFAKAKKTSTIPGETMEYRLTYKLKQGKRLIGEGQIKEFDSFLLAQQLYPSLLSGDASQVAAAEVLAQRLELSLRQILKKLTKK